MQILLFPPVAFLIYLALIVLVNLLSKALVRPGKASPFKTSTYSSGEKPPVEMTVPGYRPFFVLALFFAILHLGVLVLGTGISSPAMLIFLVGLMLALVVLILG